MRQMHILITGGATWMRVDDVRVLTNIFTGKTALFLAKEFSKNGFRVTVMINPHCIKRIASSINIIPFHYFDELKNALRAELKRKRYDMIVHTAAVSDYRVKNPIKGKVSSGKRAVTLRLVPASKLTCFIRRHARGAVLVQCKLESGRKFLIERAYQSLVRNRFDFVVANAFPDTFKRYRGCIIDKKRLLRRLSSRRELARNLLDIARIYCKNKRIRHRSRGDKRMPSPQKRGGPVA